MFATGRMAAQARRRPCSSTHATGLESNRWAAFTRLLDDGRICLSNNAAERALCGVAVGRRNWTFAGSDAGGNRAAAIYALVQTCKINDVDPQAWPADVLARLPDYPTNRVADLLPWNWKATRRSKTAAA